MKRGSKTNTGKRAEGIVQERDKYKYLGMVINTEGNIKDNI